MDVPGAKPGVIHHASQPSEPADGATLIRPTLYALVVPKQIRLHGALIKQKIAPSKVWISGNVGLT
jgi:hypothetical protein